MKKLYRFLLMPPPNCVTEEIAKIISSVCVFFLIGSKWLSLTQFSEISSIQQHIQDIVSIFYSHLHYR